jgi:PAS domain S-box-containing protein
MSDVPREVLLAELDRLRARIRTLEGEPLSPASVAHPPAFMPDEDHFRRLLETLPIVPWEGPVPMAGVPYVFRYVGPQAELLLGFPLEQWYEPNFWASRLHPEDRESAINFCLDASRQGKNHSFEYRFRAADGRIVWVLDVVRIVFADERPVAARGFLLDITARKQMEQSLQQTPEWLPLSLEATGTCCYRVDLPGEQMTSTRDLAAFHHVTDRPVETLADYYSLIHPEDRESMRSAIVHAIASGDQLRREYRAAGTAPDGGAAWYDCRARVHREAGRPRWLAGFIADNTPRKREEQQRQLLEAQMRQAQHLESLGVLAGGIAHEFNNLLTTILGYTDLARADLASESAPTYLGEVLTASQRAAELTQQILAYAGKGRSVMSPVSLGELVAQMAPLLTAAVSRKARLVLETGSGGPLVEGDTAQLRQVILELVSNASESLDQGEGTIEVRITTEPTDEPPKERVCLEVSDTGTGMSESIRARVFEPFFSTRFAGRGLGLAAALGIIRGHGGEIRVESEPGRGSRFRVLLPALSRAEQGASGEWRPGATGRLLVVDDEESVRNLAVLVLRQAGYEVVTAADGAEGLERFLESPEKFVGAVIDLTMPRLDGMELLRRLRQLRPNLPVVLMTGYSATETARRVDSPTEKTLQKPFRGSVLIEAVRRALAEMPGQ